MKTRFMRFDDTTASACRWSEFTEELFGDWDIIWENSTSDYQGSVELLAHKDGRFGYISYSYGSCSGCDSWEDQSEEAVRADFKNITEYFEDVHELQRFVNKVNYGESFETAVSEYVFHAQLEK